MRDRELHILVNHGHASHFVEDQCRADAWVSLDPKHRLFMTAVAEELPEEAEGYYHCDQCRLQQVTQQYDMYGNEYYEYYPMFYYKDMVLCDVCWMEGILKEDKPEPNWLVLIAKGFLDAYGRR